MADDDKPFRPDFKVHEYGFTIPISGDMAEYLKRTNEEHNRLLDLMYAGMFEGWAHNAHAGRWAVEQRVDPTCWLCSTAYKHRRFWKEVEAWCAAYAESIRPRCAETRDGSVSVIHHVEPCTCHEECDGDDDY